MNKVAAPARPARSFFNWKAVVGIAISVVALWYALRGVSWSAVFGEARRANPFLFLLAVFFATAVFWIRAWRWRTLLGETAPDSSFRSRLAATLIGFMGNNILPARVGEFARAYAFARMEKVPVVSAFGSLVIERLFDAIGIVALLLVTMSLPGVPDLSNLAGRNVSAATHTLAILIGVALLLAGALVIAPQKTVSFVEKYPARLLPHGMRRRFVDALEAFLSGLSVLRSPLLLSAAVVQTFVLWIFNAAGFWIGFKAFGIDLPFSAALLLQSVVAMAVSVPSAPGFFGLFEGAARLVLISGYGIPLAKMISFTLAFHMGGFIPVTLLGLYYAWKLGISLREVEASEETIEEAVEDIIPEPPGPRG
ncbi:MAG TPA: lysylphosphatidylglycerol synthase transmembrane domain-containing protein [Longimicrobiales bacterium]